MKKIIIAITSIISFATVVNADIARIEVGTGAWFQSPTTSMNYEDDSGFSGEDISDSAQEKTQGYIWLLVQHPVPLFPNLRLEYVNVNSSGIGTGNFDFFQSPISGDNKSKLEISQFDIIPYYNILDNTSWVTIDVGLDIKVVETIYSIADPQVGGFALGSTTGSFEDTSSDIVPMLYLRGRFEIPSTDIGIESDIKYITDGESDALDFRLKMDYTLEFVPVVQPSVELGYRVEKIYMVTDDDLIADFDFAGIYLGAMLRF
jgi:outer membrane protein